MTHFEICVNRKRFIPKNYFEQNFTFKIDYFEDQGRDMWYDIVILFVKIVEWSV